MKIRALAAALAVLLAAAACTGEGDPTEPPDPFTEVAFAAEDGETRSGRLFGTSGTAVVLSHMGTAGDSQDDWERYAADLAADGFQVLTYDNRNALEESWNDVLGGVRYLHDEGADRVIVAGASIGAMASLQAALVAGPEIGGVLWLAGVLDASGYAFTEPDVSALACPLLIAAGSDDSYGAAEDAALLHEWTPEVSELVIVDSIRHGTDILADDEPATADELRQAMTDFLHRVASGPATTC